MSEKLTLLLDRLEKAKFTGELKVRFESGQPASATLIHFLALSELSGGLVTVEPETDFTLKPRIVAGRSWLPLSYKPRHAIRAERQMQRKR